MSFLLSIYQTKDPQYKQYNGRVAITLGWQPNHDEPFMERYTIITPFTDDDFFVPEDPISSFNTYGNVIKFEYYKWHRVIAFDTTGMIKFTERQPVKPPTARWDKYGERKTYIWSWGRWIVNGYEKKPEDDLVLF